MARDIAMDCSSSRTVEPTEASSSQNNDNKSVDEASTSISPKSMKLTETLDTDLFGKQIDK